MRKLYFVTILASLAVLGATTGCQNVNSVERAVPLATPNHIADKRVITDYTLAKSLNLLGVIQSTVSGNLLKIQVQIENLSSSPNKLRYRFEWVGRDGMTLDSPTDLWRPLTVQGRESTTVSAVATNPNAVDFIIKFQEI